MSCNLSLNGRKNIQSSAEYLDAQGNYHGVDEVKVNQCPEKTLSVKTSDRDFAWDKLSGWGWAPGL